MSTLHFCLFFCSAIAFAQPRNLDIYWIDTEGGAATLIVTPSGQSLLVDTGNPGPNDRDPKRIFEMAKAAGLSKIDILLITRMVAWKLLSRGLYLRGLLRSLRGA